MHFDSKGLPKDGGASDYLDSCRLAAVMAVIKHPKAPEMLNYLIKDQGVRHPTSHPNNFSRDQLMPLVAGIYAQNGKSSYAKKLYTAAISRGFRSQNTHDIFGNKKSWHQGPDILNFFHMLVLGTASNIYVPIWLRILGKANAVIDIAYNAVFTQLREPNQLILSLYVLGPKWLKFYKTVTPGWKKAISIYWAGWRDEEGLAQNMIDWLDKI